uniref:Ribosomal protein eL8/eL30/eS12/Gadd45 domain-containing protein n=1 Tax=Mola mola TaxID=94237 RepID=A0A3Q3VQ71_MOLML
MATAGKLGKRENKRHIPAKTSFTSPLTSTWSPLPQEDMNFILKTLKNKLIATGLEKKELKVFRRWGKKRDHKPAPAESVLQDSPKNGWTDVAARQQLAIGINEATKALERNELKLLLVCTSVKPKHMTDHLIALSATRSVPACQVPRLSQSISEPLKLKSVLALGFRRCASKEDEVFADTVDAIAPRVLPLHVPWLQDAAPRVKPEDPVDVVEEVDVIDKRGQKRKLKTEYEDVRESASSATLQLLKVKKIVANPARKRKRNAKPPWL